MSRDDLKALAFYSAWLALLWLTFGAGVQGASHVLVFGVWCLALLSPFALTDKSITEAAKRPRAPGIARGAMQATRWLTLALLVWHGYTVTAVAWAVAMVLLAAGAGMVRDERRRVAP